MLRSELRTEGLGVVYKLKDEINRLEETVKALKVDEGGTMPPRKRAKAKKKTGDEAAGGASSASTTDFADDASSSSSRPMNEEEKLRRLVVELAADVERGEPDIELITAKMERVSKLWNEVMVDEMRSALAYYQKDSTGSAVDTLEPAELSEKVVIAAMDGEAFKHFSIADYKKKPEQPKGCSRAVWMEHLKMSKKFADCIAHMCCVHRSGNVDSIDWQTTEGALASVELWEDKWISNESMMKEIQRLVAYEIIRRVQEYEYFNCIFCNVVEFNVKQFLAHFASGTHCQKAREMIAVEDPVMSFGFAAKYIINLTNLCDDLHGFFSAQFTTPLVKSGAKVPQPSPDSIPSLDFLDEIEQKYGKKINGDFDSTRLNDPVYVASLLPDIVKNHKNELGKKLFKELHEYLGTGKSLYCRRCHWKVSNRDSFYRHVLNPYHVSMNYLEDGRQFNLITVSINVHMRDEN